MKKIVIIMFLVSLLIGCESTPTALKPFEDVFIENIELVYMEPGKLFPGGWCFESALVMLAAYYQNVSPVSQNVYDAKIALQNKHVETYMRESWGLHIKGARWDLATISQYLYEGNPVLALIDGWEDSLHAVIVNGVDNENVYYLCPMQGQKVCSHAQWHQLRAIGSHWVWIVR